MKFPRITLLIVFLFSLFQCSSSSGPSCTLWTNGSCYDYAGTTWEFQVSAKQLCEAALGIWSTDGCSYTNCGVADVNGQIECTAE